MFTMQILNELILKQSFCSWKWPFLDWLTFVHLWSLYILKETMTKYAVVIWMKFGLCSNTIVIFIVCFHLEPSTIFFGVKAAVPYSNMVFISGICLSLIQMVVYEQMRSILLSAFRVHCIARRNSQDNQNL